MRRWMIALGAAVSLVLLSVLVPAERPAPPGDAWAYEATGIRELQRQGLTGRGVRVAVLDTGLDESHLAFADSIVAGRDAFLNPAHPTTDEDGHGTHVAGIIAGSSEAHGFRGVAPGVQIHVHKVLATHERSGENRAVFLDHQVRQAIDADVDIICIAGTGGTVAAQQAAEAGVLVVAAAGTADPDDDALLDVALPARQAEVVAVAAVDSALDWMPASPSGDPGLNDGIGRDGRSDPDRKPEVSAPGQAILGPRPGGAWGLMDGTSSATAIVCGGLALVLEGASGLPGDDPSEAVERVKRTMAETAVPLHDGPFEHDDKTGYGLFRADRVLAALAEGA